MNQQPATRRARTTIWQFSILNLLVSILLVGATCGAFRLEVFSGILMLHVSIAVAISAVRTKAAVCHQEELWDALDLPEFVRRNETTHLAVTSFATALAAFFFFYLGLGMAAVLTAIVSDVLYLFANPFGLVWALICMIFITGTGLLSAVWWLKWTWPRSYFTRTVTTSSPSGKTI